MGEHLPCKQGVKSSNLSISISHISGTCTLKIAYSKFFCEKKNILISNIKTAIDRELSLDIRSFEGRFKTSEKTKKNFVNTKKENYQRYGK